MMQFSCYAIRLGNSGFLLEHSDVITRANSSVGKRRYDFKRQSGIYSGQARYADMSSIANKVHNFIHSHSVKSV